MATRPGRRYELVDDTELVINDWVAALCRMVGCAECGAETGELCDRTAEKVNYAHAERRAAAKSDVGGEGRCKECRFVEWSREPSRRCGGAGDIPWCEGRHTSAGGGLHGAGSVTSTT